jgi:diguanylate cyclase (GGDEF)-like protein
MHHTAAATLTMELDQSLVTLAVCVCIFGMMTAIRVLQLSMASHGPRRLRWLSMAALVGGCAVWSTHFVLMLAYDPRVPVDFHYGPTFASFLIAVSASAAAFAVTLKRGSLSPYIGGLLFGTGVVLMHYIGMAAMDVPGRLVWDQGQIVLSALYGISFGMLGLAALRRLPSDRGLLAGTVALVATVLLVHFTGMGALTIVPNPSAESSPSQIPEIVMAAAAIVSTCFVLTIALLCVVFDRRMAKGAAESDRQIRYMAYHDPLTGLPNRAFLADTFDEKLRQAQADGKSVALLAVDLDRFKQVNDIFGHQAGDSLLRTLSAMMTAELKAGETLARVGGDEFVIVQSGVPQPAGAEDLARRLLDAVCRDVDIDGVTFRAAASIGIALYPRDGRDVATLHPNADAALYRAKEGGRGCFRFFEPEMDLLLRARRTLQLEMRDALKRGEFKLYYQPQAGTMTGVISGFEALIRWEHPKRGLINPDEFISASEENGFIVELGEFVLRTACAEAASWTKPLNISVNLSSVQFQHGDLAALVRDVLTETGLDPKRLELEITESVLILDFNRAVEILTQIKGFGVCVAMDDFGTGYSSLAYLQAFPFDRIKIDRSFIAKLHENKQSEAIIRAIVGLGRGLDVPITAEGVETEEQQAFLADLDCAEIQGFLIGRPQPIELLEAHIGRADENGVRRAVA